MRPTTAFLGAIGLMVLAGACGGDDSNGASGGDDGGAGTDGAMSTGDGGMSTGDGGMQTGDGGMHTGDGGMQTGDGAAHNDSGPSPDSGPTGPAPVIGGCQIFPNNSPWNTPIDAAPLHPNAATFAANMAPTRALHADWGDWSPDKYGIPWQTVPGSQPKLPISFSTPAESDPGPYPFPLGIRIEPGDQHAIVIDTGACILYEAYATAVSGGGFSAGSGAKFDLHSNALRTDGWTSADAAGLPILPGLVRLAEVQAGAVNHAIRFTMNSTYNGYIHPAVHAAGSSNTSLPPMGLRLRLKASFSLSGFSGPALVVLTAMKKYGVILADNGSDWYISGDSDDGWSATIDAINQSFGRVHGSDFEAVDSGPTSTAGL